MRQSEIFEAFIKIAQEKDLIPKDAPEKAIKELEKSKRHDSISPEQMLKLYNVKPDAPKEMQYDNNIAEVAHPNKAVVSPSHDKLNGLVENINERNNILINLMNRPVDGQIFHRKNAQNNLTLNLVRLGNSLDNKNYDQLCKLSDHCLVQLNKNLTKTAWIQAALIAVPSLLGALYLHQHLDDTDQGFTANSERLQKEVNDFITSNDNFGTGYKYRPEFIQEMQKFENILETLSNQVKQAYLVLDEIEKPKTTKELTRLASQTESNSAIQAYNKVKEEITEYEPYFKKLAADFSSPNYKARQIEHSGAITDLLDRYKLHGGSGLIKDDFDDVIRALPSFINSYQGLLTALKTANSIQSAAKKDIENYQSSSQEDPKKEDHEQGMGDRFEDIAKELTGFGH